MTDPVAPAPVKRRRKPRAAPDPARLLAVRTGREGEAIAQQLAMSRGWRPWEHNVQLGRNEADLVMVRDDAGGRRGLLLEVKASRTLHRPDQIEAFARRLGPRQQAALWKMAAALADGQGWQSVAVALVLVSIAPGRERAVWLDLEPF